MPSEPSRSTGYVSALGLLILCSIGFAVTPIRNAIVQPGYNKDYSLWYAIGLVVRNNGPLYEAGANGEILYMYPPTFALILAPITYLGPIGFVIVFTLATAIAWALSFRLAMSLATGQSTSPSRWYEWLVLISTGPYVYDLFLLGQINLVLLLLVLYAARCLQRNRPGVAGICLGLAIAIKVFPMPILVYWAVRKEYRAIASAIVSCVVLVFVLPGMIRGFERTQNEIAQWQRAMLGDSSGQSMSARSSVGFSRRNQSLFAVTHRLTRELETGDGVHVNVLNMTPQQSQIVALALIIALGLVLLISTRCRFAPTAETAATETAMVLILTVLCSPLGWTYFYCWLLPAWAVAFHASRDQPRYRIPLGIAACLLIAAISEQVDPTLQAIGVTAWGSVVLYGTLAWIRVRQSPN